jgi:hypothetical protein
MAAQHEIPLAVGQTILGIGIVGEQDTRMEFGSGAREGVAGAELLAPYVAKADQFELLTVALNEVMAGRAVGFPLKAGGVFGPDAPPPPASSLSDLDEFAFRDAFRAVHEFIHVERRVPARVFVGAQALPPADFLTAMAAAWTSHRQSNQPPLSGQNLRLCQNTRILPERHVAKDTPGLFGEWVIHKTGFRAPKVVELARLQTWTLKPATPGR